MASPHTIKILHIIDHLGAGGAQEIILNLVQGLDRENFEQNVLFFFNKDRYGSRIVSAGAGVHAFSWGPYTYANVVLNLCNPFRYLRLRSYLKKSNAHIIHVHLYFAYLITAIAGYRSGTKIVYTMHAMRNQLPRFFKIMRFWSGGIHRFVADLFTTEEELATVGISKNKLQTIHIATDYHLRPPGNFQRVRDEFNIGKEDYLALDVSRLHRQKGHQYLIESFSYVTQQIPNAKLIIVGSGEEEQQLRQQIKKLALEQRVFLAGYRENLIDFYDAADIFVSAAIQEALGIAILEAMARGKPVVAFDVGALHTLVKSNVTGKLVPRGDIKELGHAISELLYDRGRTREYQQNCIKQISDHFSLRHFVDQYASLYKKLYGKNQAA